MKAKVVELAKLVGNVTGGNVGDFLSWLKCALRGEAPHDRAGVVLFGVPGSGKTMLLNILRMLYPQIVHTANGPDINGWGDMPMMGAATRVAVFDAVTTDDFRRLGKWLFDPPLGVQVLVATNDMMVETETRRFRAYQSTGAIAAAVVAGIVDDIVRVAPSADAWRDWLEGRTIVAVGPCATGDLDQQGDRLTQEALAEIVAEEPGVVTLLEAQYKINGPVGVEVAPRALVDGAVEATMLVGDGKLAAMIRAGVVKACIRGEIVEAVRVGDVREIRKVRNIGVSLTANPIGTQGALREVR